MKGIVLAGGSGTRLHPITNAISKQIMPVYDKPMIYYPLSTLMLAGIREILIISSPEYLDNYRRLFGDGSELGLAIEYALQPRPEGLAQAFLLTEDHIAGHNTCLVLGDNVFFGHGMPELTHEAMLRENGATIFGYHVRDPQRYGEVEFDANRRLDSNEEKPLTPKSNFAVTGLYFYDSDVVDIARAVRPSVRGELEITDVNNMYLQQGSLTYDILDGWWTDAGTFQSLRRATNLVAETGANLMKLPER